MKKSTILAGAGLLLLAGSSAMAALPDPVQVDGIFYQVTGEKTCRVMPDVTGGPNTNSYKGAYNVPSTVVIDGKTYTVNEIGNGAFARCWDVTGVTLPPTIERIDSQAFASSRGIKTLTLPASLRVIESEAFSFSGLTELTIEEGLDSVGYGALGYLNSFTDTLRLPASLRAMSPAALAFSHKLQAISVSPDNPYWKSDGGVVFSKDGSTLFAFPCYKYEEQYSIPSSVKYIERHSCSNLDRMTAFKFPYSQIKIGKEAFTACTKLEQVTNASNVVEIDSAAFAGCTHMQLFEAGYGLKRICDNAFNNVSRYNDDGYFEIKLDYANNLYDYYPDAISHIYMRLGKTAYYLGRYTSGMSVIYDLMRIYPDLDLSLNIQALTQLANYFIRLEKSSLAIRYLTDATVDLKRLRGDSKLIRKLESEIDIAFSSAYFFKGDSEKFLHYINKARKNCDENNISRVYQNMSINYLIYENVEKSKEFNRKAYSVSKNPYERAVIQNNYAILCLDGGDLKEALAICRENEKELDKFDAIHVKGQLYNILSRIYTEMGNHREALLCLKKESAILDSVFNKESDEKLMMMANEFETERIKNDMTMLEYKLKIAEYESFRKTTLIAILAAIALLVAGATVYIIKRARRQKKSLEEDMATLSHDKDAEMSSSRHQFESIISDKSRELALSSMFMAKIGDAAGTLKGQLEELCPYCTDARSVELLNSLRAGIDSLSPDEKDWEEFMLHFGQTNPSFFARLHARHPNLTSGDNRICAFIVMNMSTKEIAAMTNAPCAP